MNSHLAKSKMKVEDLFQDLGDGTMLLTLLEKLSGQPIKFKR